MTTEREAESDSGGFRWRELNEVGDGRKSGGVGHSPADNGANETLLSLKRKGPKVAAFGPYFRPKNNGQERFIVMGNLNQFDLRVYSEETHPVTEQEYAEVMEAISLEEGSKAHAEWSEQREQGSLVCTPHGTILLNRDCNHGACKTTRCEVGPRIGGIAI